MRDDARFREIVGDYEVARGALQHWRQEDPPGSRRIVDYEEIVRELEEEIEANLTPPSVRPRHPDAPASHDQRSRAFITLPFRKPKEASP
jgi:hypothetical protein